MTISVKDCTHGFYLTLYVTCFLTVSYEIYNYSIHHQTPGDAAIERCGLVEHTMLSLT